MWDGTVLTVQIFLDLRQTSHGHSEGTDKSVLIAAPPILLLVLINTVGPTVHFWDESFQIAHFSVIRFGD